MVFVVRVIVEPKKFLYVSDFVKFVSFTSDKDHALLIHDRDLALDIQEYLKRKNPDFNFDILEV